MQRLSRWARRSAALLAGACLALPALAAHGVLPYRWRSVRVGGGGFAPAIIFSPLERDLAYLRTDMGGVYRWSARQGRWRALEDQLDTSSDFGIESIALDPRNANVLYVAAGMYPNRPAALLRSRDRGAHWRSFPTPFRMGGNMPGRGLGERLAVDPNDPAILYFGSRYDGLQRSIDRGEQWQPVRSFPWRGRGWRASPPGQAGISFVVPDPAGGAPGRPSRRLFVGLTLVGRAHLFSSSDAGATWRAVPGQPGADLLPVQAALGARGRLYITYSNGVGPNGISSGAVYRYDPRRRRWRNITPPMSHGPGRGGFMGLAVDAARPGLLLVATVDRWRGGDLLWRSVDGGRQWQNVRAHSRRDVSTTPFLRWGRAHARFGWWIAGVAIDPFDPSHAAYTTGATVYATGELNHVGRGREVLWRPWVRGVEQTAVLTLLSPPHGPHLLSGFGDLSGFAHDHLNRSPRAQFIHPVFANTDDIDEAGLAPAVVVRGGTRAPHSAPGAPTLAYSLDDGRTWQPLWAPGPTGQIVVSPRGRTFIALTATPVFTRDHGASWRTVRGLPRGAHPVADRALAGRFYAMDLRTGRLFVSADGGSVFHERATRGLPQRLTPDQPRSAEQPWPLIATPGRAGDLWFVSRRGLFHSRDGGRSFRQLNGGVHVVALSFGKAAPGRHYPTLYALARHHQVLAVWRSEDAGRQWRRLNGRRHRYGQRFRCIAGDPRIFGRVYVGTDGRGILYGDPRRR